jgi:uncharacterized OB-fold protein
MTQRGVDLMSTFEYKLVFKDFNASLKKNKLLALHCKDCGKHTCPPKLVCHECGNTNLDVATLSGKGNIVTFTASYITAMGREAEAPVLVVMIELEEGPWILGNLVGIDPDRATMESLMGKPVYLARTRMLPPDQYSGGKELKGGFARPTFSLA